MGTHTHTYKHTSHPSTSCESLISFKEEMLIFSNIAVVLSALHIIFYLTTCGEVLRRGKAVLGSWRRSGVRDWEAERDVSCRELRQSEGSGDC